MMKGDKLTRETFAVRQGERFRLRAGEEELETVLVEVVGRGVAPSGKPLQATGAPPHREPFSLLFRAPRQPPLPQQIYPLDHDELGTLELFLVPVGEDDEGRYYEAVFT